MHETTYRRTGHGPGLRARAALTVAVAGLAVLPALSPVAAAQDTSPSPTSQSYRPAASTATVTATTHSVFDSDVTLDVSLAGFGPASTVTATIDGHPVVFGTRTTTPTQLVGADGTWKGAVSAPAGVAAAGPDHTLTVVDDKGTRAEVVFHTIPSFDFNDAANPRASTFVAGSTGTATVANLPVGATLTFLGVGTTDFLPGDLVAAADAGAGGAAITIPALAIPATPGVVGQRVRVEYTVDGKAYQADTAYFIAANTAPSHTADFDVRQVDLRDGLYQSAYSATTDSVFVTRTSGGRGEPTTSSILKLDARTLAVQLDKEITPATPDAPLQSVFGLGLDDGLGYVWVTNSRTDGIAVYRQSDLSLVKQFSGTTQHARDIIVDPVTHRVFASRPTAPNGGAIDVYDGTTLTKTGEIQLPGFGGPMSLDLDPATGELFTVSLEAAHAVRVDTRHGDAVTTYDIPGQPTDTSPSGVAWDPVRRTLWIACQWSNELLALDVDTKKVAARIPTGAGAISAELDAVHRIVYVASFGADTVQAVDADTHAPLGTVSAGLSVNHLSSDGKGHVFAVNKGAHSVPGKTGQFDYLTEITAKRTAGTNPAGAGSLDTGSLGGPSSSAGSLDALFPAGS